MAGIVTVTAVALLMVSALIGSLDPDEEPVTVRTWLWAAGGFGVGIVLFALGVRRLPRSPYRAPRRGW